MMNEDHYDEAQKWLNLSGTTYSKGSAIATAGEAAVYSIAHAVLALLDYLQQDDTTTEQWEATSTRLSEIVARQEDHIRNLEEDLAGAYAALRARETADAAEMKSDTPC